MRFNCDWLQQRNERRWKRRYQWHRWFAWRPVRIAAGDRRWLEFVERRRQCGKYFVEWEYWDYRAIERAA
ncbi:hypothetical protein [Bradyrhizobium sp. 179]|uniref:hypothetical protein n=1 Tax=Bradyrhizobium sp. 179 TaxID=2782648 RepID=UPI001FFBB099|nr:hypothetical protein [Bradyrhizobium sp. 179]